MDCAGKKLPLLRWRGAIGVAHFVTQRGRKQMERHRSHFGSVLNFFGVYDLEI